MSALDDLKERFISEAKTIWDRIQDTSMYQQMRDRYENLNPTQQRLVTFGSIALALLLLFSIPYSYYSDSANFVDSFTSRRDLVRELFKVAKQSSEIPMIPQPPSGNVLTEQIQRMLTQAQLVPEQIKTVTPSLPTSRLIPNALAESGATVSLAKLNLNQVTEIGFQLLTISPSLKMSNMSIQANAQDTRYMDVTYELVALKVPQITMDVAPPDDNPPAKKGSPPRKKGGGG